MYESLTKKYKNQNARKYFAHFPYNPGEDQTWETSFSYLAKMTNNIILGSIQTLKEKVKRNYKIAIPHWYENKIQLLLPLVLTNEENIAELAFVVDKDKQRNIYRGKTILTMDMAYIDARLITKPDDDWLTP